MVIQLQCSKLGKVCPANEFELTLLKSGGLPIKNFSVSQLLHFQVWHAALELYSQFQAG
jgi:hypothetical protein